MRQSLVLMIAGGVLLAGCAGPGAVPAATSAQAPQLNCSACIEDNPGDVRPCEKICHAPAADSAGVNAGGVIH